MIKHTFAFVTILMTSCTLFAEPGTIDRDSAKHSICVNGCTWVKDSCVYGCSFTGQDQDCVASCEREENVCKSNCDTAKQECSVEVDNCYMKCVSLEKVGKETLAESKARGKCTTACFDEYNKCLKGE